MKLRLFILAEIIIIGSVVCCCKAYFGGCTGNVCEAAAGEIRWLYRALAGIITAQSLWGICYRKQAAAFSSMMRFGIPVSPTVIYYLSIASMIIGAGIVFYSFL